MIASTAVACAPSIPAQNASFQSGGLPVTVGEHGAWLPQPNKGIFELRDTFWHLEKLQGLTTSFSGVIVNIFVNRDGGTGILTFSTPSASIPFSFVYEPTGLKFLPVGARGGVGENSGLTQDQQIGGMFEKKLQSICSYELRNGLLILEDINQRSIIVLSAVRQEGIENRRWRIAEYRGGDNKSGQKDELIDAKLPTEALFMNGRLSGAPGCGAWVGKYSISGDTLTTSDVDVILAGLCSSEQSEQGAWVMKALKGERRIEKEGSNILLRDNTGRTMLLLVPFWPR
jgi:heat shock protein HslJ